MGKSSLKSLDLIDHQAVAKFSGNPIVSYLTKEGSISGHHRSNHKGSSIEFSEYREYSPGEDLRKLDWRVMARTDRLFLKEFEAETNLRCYLCLDCSKSMRFGEICSKFEFGKRILSTLCYLFLKQGDAVGLNLLSGKKNIEIKAKRNPDQLKFILERIYKAKANGDQELIPSLHRVAESVERQALFIVVSDFLDDSVEINRAIHHLRDRNHEVILFHLLDPQEVDFNFKRPTRFIDIETGSSILTHPRDIREQYLIELENHKNELIEGCLESNCSYNDLITNISVSTALQSFLQNQTPIKNK